MGGLTYIHLRMYDFICQLWLVYQIVMIRVISCGIYQCKTRSSQLYRERADGIRDEPILMVLGPNRREQDY